MQESTKTRPGSVENIGYDHIRAFGRAEGDCWNLLLLAPEVPVDLQHVAIEAAPTLSAGLSTFSPWAIA